MGSIPVELWGSWIGFATFLLTGLGAWYKMRQSDREKAQARQDKIVTDYEERLEKLQEKIYSLMTDAIAREKERNDTSRETLEMLKASSGIVKDNVATMKEVAVLLLALKEKPRG